MTAKYEQSLDDLDEFLNVLYYGEPGCGKTSAAAAMAHLGTVYLVDVESGAKKKPLRMLGIPTNRIRPVKVEGYKDLERFYWELKQRLDEPGHDIAGVIFDSISEIHDLLIREQVDVRHGKAIRKATNPRTGELVQEVDDNQFQVELQERGIVTEQLRQLTRWFRDLPCHVVFVALAKREVEGDGIVYLPQLPPKFGGNLRGFVDMVAYMVRVPDVDDSSAFLGVFRDTGRYKGKDRLSATPPVLAHPSFDRLAALVFDETDLGTDPHQLSYLARVRPSSPTPETEPDTESE